MNEKPSPDAPEDFLERLRHLEAQLSLKEDEIRALRRDLRGVEEAVWQSMEAGPEVEKAAPETEPPEPPPLPTGVAARMGTTQPVPPAASDDEPEPQAEPVEEPAPTLRIELPEEVRQATPAAPPAPEAAKPKGDLETRIGGVWFNRIGLVILIIGFALMARLIVPNLQPWMKLAAMYLASWALLGAGLFFDRRYPTFTRPVIAGALALSFFASFAGHYIEATACLPLPLSLIFMFLSTLCVLLFAEKWDSESTAGLAMFLGHVAAYVGGVEAGTVPLVAILLLTATAAVLFVRHRWQPLSLFAVVAAYASHTLWYIQDHGARDPSGWFWLNFAFLASYYVCFLLADLLLRRSEERGTRDEEQRSAATSIGGVGAVSMVLYSASTVCLFHHTGLYWSSLHLFLLPFAALQAALTVLYALRKQAGYPLYAVAAILFATLGLFAWLEGLTLTLTLAVEGLVVMVLARREGFRFLYPVAQLVLAAGYIHYWTWGAEAEVRWPSLLANLTAALAFLFAAYLGERWPETEGETEATPFALSSHPRRLAGLHAIGAGVMAAHQLGASLPAPHASLALTLAILLVLALSLVLRARCWAWPIWILQLRLAAEVWILSVDLEPTLLAAPWTESRLWLVHQALALALTVAAAAAMLWGMARRRAAAVATGAGMLVLGVAIPAVAPYVGQPEVISPAMVLATPLLYWALGALGRREITDWRFGDGWLAPVERATVSGLGRLRCVFACLGAALLSIAVWQTYPTFDALLYLAAISGVALVVTVLLDAPALAAGLVLHAVLLTVRMLTRSADLSEVGLAEVNWVFLAAILPALGLAGGAWWKRRASFALSSRALLGCFALGALAARCLDMPIGRPLWLWIGVLAAAWVLIEALSRLLRDPERGWRDRHGLRYLRATSVPAGFLYALALTLLFLVVLDAQFGTGIQVCWALFATTVVYAAGALALRSPRLALANALTLAAVFGVLVLRVGLDRAVLDHPVFVVCLALLTLGQGVCAEIIHRTLGITTRAVNWRASLSLLSLLYYAAALALALVAIDLRITSVTPYVMAAQSTLLLLLFLGAMVLRVPRLAWFTLAATGAILLFSMERLFAGPDAYHVHLLPASLATAAQLVVVERILSRSSAAFLEAKQNGLLRPYRIAIVLATALLAALACLYAAGMQGYLTTLGWSVVALVMMALGFAWKDRAYRYTALTLFLLSIGRAALIDISGLGPGYRVAAFICLGACLLAVSFLYTRFRERIREWL